MKTPNMTEPSFDTLVGPSVNDVCAWLASKPSLDNVAARLRFLRLVQSELDDVVTLLRQHVMVEIGDRSIDTSHDVPF